MGNLKTISINVNQKRFLWHLDLMWFAHKEIYGSSAKDKFLSALVSHNYKQDIVHDHILCDTDAPYKICKPYFYDPVISSSLEKVIEGLCVPLNIQTALRDVVYNLSDNQLIEVVDHDMLHIKHHPNFDIRENELIVCDLYEKWHLHSTTEHKHIIQKYTTNSNIHNGGFVPVIGLASTFKRILSDWINIHVDILNDQYSNQLIYWWAGMYSLNAACAKNNVKMISQDICYIPGLNSLNNNHYMVHYSIDSIFNKKTYPKIDLTKFPNNTYYNLLQRWPNFLKI